MITIESKGSFKNLDKFLQRMSKGDIFRSLDQYGREGAQALASATPKESGLTAASWGYEVFNDRAGWTIRWYNSNVVDGVPVAILLQVGHGTGTGGYVSGRDYINPALKPVFDRIAESVWKVVTSA